MSEADVGDMAVVNLPVIIPLNFVAIWQMTAERQSDKMASDMEVRMKQRCVIEFLLAEKIAPNDNHRRLLKVYGVQTVDVSTMRRWLVRFISGDSDVKDKARAGRPCTTVTWRNEKCLDQLISVNWQITTKELCVKLNVGFSALEMVVTCWNIPKFAPGRSHECPHRNIKNTVCKFVRTYWTNTTLKVTVSWIASSPVTRCGITTTSWSQNSSPWSGNMCIPRQRKSSRRCRQQVKWRPLSFGIGKGWYFWISLNPYKPSTLTATSWCWLRWRINFSELGQRRRLLFSYNTITPGTIPVWRPWSTFQSWLDCHTAPTV